MGIFDTLFGKKKQQNDGVPVPILSAELERASSLSFEDLIAPEALKIEPRYLRLGDKILRTYFIISLPSTLPEDWFTPMINLERIFDVSIFIHPIDTTKALRAFQKKVAEVQSQIMAREEKGLVRDPILDTAFRNLEELRDSLQMAEEKLFDIGIYITVYADKEEDLYKVENEMKSRLESKLVYIKPALYQQIEGFKSSIPTGTDELAVHQKLNTAPISSIFPFVSFDLNSDKGILYGINRHNSSLVLFDRFSLENYNSIIFAKSGSGKSYTTKV